MYIKVKVVASAKKEIIKKISNDTYHISIREPAERNLANKRICELMSLIYTVNIKAIRIISGHHSSSKILSINI